MCEEKCDFFLYHQCEEGKKAHARPNAFPFGWYYFGWLSCCCCLFGWFFTSIRNNILDHILQCQPTMRWIRWCVHVWVDNTLCVFVVVRKESEIVRSSTWTKFLKWIASIVPNSFAAAAVICAFFANVANLLLFTSLIFSCCYCCHCFRPVVLMSLGSSIIEFMMSMCKRPFFRMLHTALLNRIRILTHAHTHIALCGVFVILLLTLKLDGFFWNRTVCGFM